MMTATDHPLVQDYLTRLREESRRLPLDQARELEADITEHLQVALGEDPGEVRVRDALDRLGSPTELVTEAGGTPSAAAAEPGKRSFDSPVGAIACLVAAELLSVLVPIAFVLWVVGLILLARAMVWTEREKLLGFLGLGSGFFVSLGIFGLGLMASRSDGVACSEVSTTDGTVVPSSSDCTQASGGIGAIGVILLMLIAAYVAFQVFTIWRLARATSRATTAR
jgi:hypothetical protein